MKEIDKIPPQNVEIEEMVLGAILIEAAALPKVVDLLTPEIFYKETNGKIYNSIYELYSEGSKIDVLTVCNRLEKNKHLESVGGAYNVTLLINRVASASNLEEWVRIIVEKWMQRECIKFASELTNRAFDDSEPIYDTIDYFDIQIKNIQEKYFEKDLTPDEIVKLCQNEAYKRANNFNKGIPNCIASPVDSINRKIAGAERGEVVVLAARPSMGKTQFALKWAEHASKYGHNPLFISLEMTVESLVNRRICSEAGIDSFNYRIGSLSVDALKNYDIAAKQIKENPINIVRASDLNSIKSKIRNYVNKFGCEIAFIDYLQLIKHEGKNDNSEISKISRELNLLAKELDIPIVLLSQLSRNVEQRGGYKIPILADLRDSGAIEQDADLIMFLWRPFYYGFVEFDYGGIQYTGMNESDIFMIVPKFRNGAVGLVHFKCTERMAGFTDAEEIWHQGNNNFNNSPNF